MFPICHPHPVVTVGRIFADFKVQPLKIVAWQSFFFSGTQEALRHCVPVSHTASSGYLRPAYPSSSPRV
jgi:hypothetical protein